MTIESNFDDIVKYYPNGMDSILEQIQSIIDTESIKRIKLYKYTLFYMPFEFLVINENTFEYKSFKKEKHAVDYCLKI